MSEHFIEELEAKFGQQNIDSLSNERLMVFDRWTVDETEHKIKRTFFTTSSQLEENERYFDVDNPNGQLIKHICIDGGFIPYGQQKYDTNSTKSRDGRPDCILFTNSRFIFLELKVEQEDLTWEKEDTKWNAFFKGVTQIEDFVNFWRGQNFEIKNYFENILAVVCMRFIPQPPKSNSSRNSELYKRSMNLGFEIVRHDYQNKFQF